MTRSKTPLALEKGEIATVDHFSDDILACKLIAMGVLPGSTIEFMRKSPFGGTIYLRVDRQFIAIRKEEAECIKLK